MLAAAGARSDRQERTALQSGHTMPEAPGEAGSQTTGLEFDIALSELYLICVHGWGGVVLSLFISPLRELH